MSLGRCDSMKLKRNGINGDEELGLEVVKVMKHMRSFGRKRISISMSDEIDSVLLDWAPSTPLKRHCSGRFCLEPGRSVLESLPQDILIRIICGVEHDDLKHLFHVSKAIREAALIAKQLHFAYSTPTKIKAFRTPIDFENPGELDDFEAPNAPLRSQKWRSSKKNLADVSVALFSSPKKGLFMDIEV